MRKIRWITITVLMLFLLVGMLPGIGASQNPPERFLLYFSDAYLVHSPDDGALQIVAVSNVLSYGGDWEVKQLNPALYHLRQQIWKGFFWKVDTNLKKVWRVSNGTFGQPGGTDIEELPKLMEGKILSHYGLLNKKVHLKARRPQRRGIPILVPKQMGHAR